MPGAFFGARMFARALTVIVFTTSFVSSASTTPPVREAARRSSVAPAVRPSPTLSPTRTHRSRHTASAAPRVRPTRSTARRPKRARAEPRPVAKPASDWLPWEKRLGFHWPVKGWVTSDFGRRGRAFHHGMDIACKWGRKVRASKAGEVVYVANHSVYGLTVVLAHAKGYSTLYGHLARIWVRTGQRVDAGKAIGRCGSTGRSTGSHLHFELRRNGKHFPPRAFLHGKFGW